MTSAALAVDSVPDVAPSSLTRQGRWLVSPAYDLAFIIFSAVLIIFPHATYMAVGKNILVDGSSVLIQILVQHDLVDEYSLHVYPLVLGGGKRLFPEGKRFDLTLVEASPLPTGVVFMRYRRTAQG